MEQHDKILFDIKSENFSNGLPEHGSPIIQIMKLIVNFYPNSFIFVASVMKQ